MDYVMKLWGQSYITQENMLSFFTFPPTIFLILLLIIIISVMLFIEITTMVLYCSTEKMSHRPNFICLIKYGIKRSLHCIVSRNYALPFYSILLFIFTITPILIGVAVYARIDLPGGKSDGAFIKGLIICGLIYLCFIVFHSMFAIYYCIYEHQGLACAIVQSKQLIKGRGFKTVRTLIFYNLLLTLGFFLFYYLVLFLTALFIYLFSDKTIIITIFLSVYPKINFYTFIFFSVLAFITNINLITSLFTIYREEEFKELQPEEGAFPRITLPADTKKRNPILTGIFIFILAAGLSNLYLTVRNDSFYLKEALSGILITSHRGNSHVAPENTMPALENAIIARSDYAEIDIQQTKDQIPVLLHDSNLWRTTGMNRNIWDLTYKEVRNLDAGSWYGEEFVNTPIPTLEEAFEFCKGQIKLNIEIKANGHVKNIAEILVNMIEEYDFEYQCVVSSTDYNILVKIKQLNNDIKTGYIMTATYGDFYHREFIDFFSIRSGFISKTVVSQAHQAGKEVHAWTVNSANEIERMKSLSVDSIITDNPTLAREIIYRNDKNKSLIELINRMLYHRTFYKIVH
jgi:glycerophosphoryl diester phosphodiesterase